MTVTKHRSGRRCGEARLLAAGVLACGAVLLPAGAAFAQDNTMNDGMMCPHAVGDVSNPATSAPPINTRANESPLGAKPSAATRPAVRPAVKPATKAPAQRAATTTPASTRAARPATATARSTTGATASAAVARVQRAAAPVAQVRPSASARPQTHRATPQRSAPARHAATPRVTTTVIPDVTRPSVASAPQLVARTTAAAQPADVRWLALGGALMLAGLAAAVALLRRRGDDGEAAAATGNGPLEPSLARREAPEADEVEAALRELLAEARASELLGTGDAGSGAPTPLVTS
jgi:hypothetical protein